MSGVLFGLSLLAFILGALATALPGKQFSTKAAFTLAALGGLLAVGAGLAAIYGAPFNGVVDLGYGVGAAGLRLDRLVGLFVFISGIVVVPVSIYSLEYRVQGRRRVFAALYNLLLVATLLVLAADSAFLFLIFWEVVTILFYGLVVFEDRRVGRISAGYVYSAASKLGTALILAAFLVAFASTGSLSFETIAQSSMPSMYKDAAFILAFIGFGLKAGMVPVQIWLPDAHSKSPKPISALLAGAILNLGFYGLVRFNLQTLGPGPEWWGILVLLVGGVSAAVGILYGIAQKDLSRFVAYSSVENAGIILLGIGVSMLGWSAGLGPLAGLGLLVALYHMLHHSVSKALLFLGVGAVEHASGTTEMDRLGGLGHRMPLTSVLFFVGAFSLAAMPPSSGFVTEWLSFETLMQGFRLSSLTGSISMALAGSLLALASGLAILGFVNMYGSVFLGRPRSKYPATAGEPPVTGRAGMTLLALLAAALGVLAPIWIKLIGQATSGVVFEDISPQMFGTPSLVLQPAFPDFSVVSPTLLAIALPLLLLLPLGIVAAVRRPGTRRGPVWASGETRLEGTEYTSWGFSNPIRTVFAVFYRPSEEVQGRTYTARILPWLESSAYQMAAALLLWITRRMKIIQSGNLSAYLMYLFGVLLVTAIR
jgi:hydrogenase-4 component B